MERVYLHVLFFLFGYVCHGVSEAKVKEEREKDLSSFHLGGLSWGYVPNFGGPLTLCDETM